MTNRLVEVPVLETVALPVVVAPTMQLEVRHLGLLPVRLNNKKPDIFRAS
jgi:hypothetical protein